MNHQALDDLFGGGLTGPAKLYEALRDQPK